MTVAIAVVAVLSSGVPVVNYLANFLKLTDFYELKILKFMRHAHHNNDKLQTVFQNYFVTNENSYKYDTRQSKHYQIHKAKRRWCNKMMRNKGPVCGMLYLPHSKAFKTQKGSLSN